MATARERLVIEVEVDLRNQAAVTAFARATAADFKAIQQAAAAVNQTTRQMNQALAGSAAAGRALQAAARGAQQAATPIRQIAAGLQQVAQQAPRAAAGIGQVAAAANQAARSAAGVGSAFRDVFQNAILGFQVFSVGLKNVGSQGFNQVFKGVQDLSRNIFRSFRGISTEGESIFGKLISFIGSSLEGVVTIAGNTASNVIKAFAAIPKAIGGIFGGLAQSVGGALLFFPAGLTKVIGIFTAGFGSIAKVATDVLGGALSTVGQIAENVSRIVSGALRGLTTVAREVADRIVSIFEGLVGAVGTVFGIVAEVAGKALAGIGTVGAVAAGIVLNDFAKFDAGMRRVFASVGASTEGAKKELSDFAQSIRTEFGRGGAEIAQGLFLAVTSGADSTAEALANFREAVRLTTAFGGDLNTTLLTISRILEVYRGEVQSAAEVSELLAKVVVRGQAEFQELSRTIGNITATASAAGIPLRELLATLTTLTQRLPTDVAVTALQRLIETLTSAQPEADAFRRKIGLAFTDLPPDIAKVIASLQQNRDALAAQVAEMEELGDSTKKVREDLKALDATLENITRRGRQFVGLTASITQFFKALQSGAATPGDIRRLFPEVRERRAILQTAQDQGFISLQQEVEFFNQTTNILERQILELQDSISFTFDRLVQTSLVGGNKIAAAFGPVIVAGLKELRILLAQAGADLDKFFASADFTAFREDLRQGLVEFIQGIPGAVRSIVEFGSTVKRVFGEVKTFVTPIFDFIGERLRNLFAAFSQGPSLRNVFEGLGDGDFGPLSEKLSAAFAAIRLDPIFTALEIGFRNVAADFIDLLATGMESISSILATAVAGVKEAIGQIASILRPFVGIGAFATKEGANLPGDFQKIGAIFSLDFKRVGEIEAQQDAVDSAVDAMSDFAKSALDSAETLKGSFEETRAAVEQDVGAVVSTVREYTAAIREEGAARAEASARAAAVNEVVRRFAEDAAAQEQALKDATAAGEAYVDFLERQTIALADFLKSGSIEAFAQDFRQKAANAIGSSLFGILPKPTSTAGAAKAPGLRPEDEEAARQALEALERSIRDAKANSERLAREIQQAKDAIVDANLEAAELVRDRLDVLRETASADIGQLATLGKKNSSFTLQAVREASEQKKLAAGTLKGIDILAKSFASLGDRESAVLDPHLLANQLGVALADVIPTLVESFKVLFGQEPRGGALGAAATRQAENFLATRSAQTALKLLAKDGDAASAAFRAFAESRGGAGEFTTELFEAAQTTAFTTGNFTALNTITRELTEEFGDVATGLKALGAGTGGGGAAANQAVADAAQAAQQSAKENKLTNSELKAQKGFLKSLEALANKNDADAIAAAIRKVEEKGTATDIGTGEVQGLSKSEQFQLDTLKKLRDAVTGSGDAQQQKIDSVGSILLPVTVTPKEKEGLLVALSQASIDGIDGPIVAELKFINEGVVSGFGDLISTTKLAAQHIANFIKIGTSNIVDTLIALFGGDGPGGAQNRINLKGGVGSFPTIALAGGGVTKKDTPATVHKGEVIAPLAGFYREMRQAVALAFRSNAQSAGLSRAGLSVKPTGFASSASPGRTASGSEARLSSLANAGRGFEQSVGTFANRIEAYVGATERSINAARSSLDSVGASLDARTRTLEKVASEEASKVRRHGRSYKPPAPRSVP